MGVCVRACLVLFCASSAVFALFPAQENEEKGYSENKILQETKTPRVDRTDQPWLMAPNHIRTENHPLNPSTKPYTYDVLFISCCDWRNAQHIPEKNSLMQMRAEMMLLFSLASPCEEDKKQLV